MEKLKLVVFSTLLVGAAMVPFINWALSYVSKNPALHFNINLWLTLVLYGALERAGAVNVQAQTFNKIVNWHKVNGATGSFIMISMVPMVKAF